VSQDEAAIDEPAVRVTAEMIERYSRAGGFALRRAPDGRLIAPPTFTTVLRFRSGHLVGADQLNEDGTGRHRDLLPGQRIMAGGAQVELTAPILEDDEVRMVRSGVSREQKTGRSGDFTLERARIEFRNERDELVGVEISETLIFDGAVAG
jgi:hypothetical protein